jgi:hypothetical protein
MVFSMWHKWRKFQLEVCVSETMSLFFGTETARKTDNIVKEGGGGLSVIMLLCAAYGCSRHRTHGPPHHHHTTNEAIARPEGGALRD